MEKVVELENIPNGRLSYRFAKSGDTTSGLGYVVMRVARKDPASGEISELACRPV